MRELLAGAIHLTEVAVLSVCVLTLALVRSTLDRRAILI